MSRHARLAPSAGHRWVPCPGSPNLIASLPDDQQDVPGKDSLWGTVVHKVLSSALSDGVTPQSYVGQIMSAEDPDVPLKDQSFTITEEDAANAGVAYAYVMRRIGEYGTGVEVWVEQRVDSGANFHRRDPVLGVEMPAPTTDCWGTADVVLHGSGYLEIIDYKNGQRWVQHEGNIQLLLYALGAMKYCEAGSVQRVRLTIVQPRAVVAAAPEGDVMREAVRTWEFPVSDLAGWAVTLGEAAHATQGENPALVAGEHCRATFCPAQGICPALNKAAVTALRGGDNGARFGEDPNTTVEEDLAQAAATDTLAASLAVDPGTMSIEQLRTVLDAREMIRSWLNACETHAHTLLMKGEHVPGWKLVMGRRSREWRKPADEMLAQFGKWNRVSEDGKTRKLRREHYAVVDVLSPAQAEKRIKPMVTPKTWESIEALIQVNEGKPTLAPETDHRKEVVVKSGEEVFAIDNETSAVPELPDFLRL